MKEANIQTAFGRYLQSKENIFRNTNAAFELKLINLSKKQKLILNSSNPESNTVKMHQLQGLIMAKSGLYHKVSDSPIFANSKSRFTWKKPFDCLFLTANGAFVGIAYYMPNKLNMLYLISVDAFLRLKEDWIELKKVSIKYEEFIARFGGTVLEVNLKPYMYKKNR